MSRPDHLKIFMGSLDGRVNKPMLQALMDSKGFNPVEIHVPQLTKGKLAFAFATFSTWEQSEAAVDILNGLVDNNLSPNCVKALIGDTSLESLSVHLAKIFLVWTLGLC